MQTYYFKEFDVWLPYPEEWKPIKDFEKLYEISNYGRTKSLAKSWIAGQGRILTKQETFLRYLNNGQDYLFVILSKNTKRKRHKIHHLVWDHFGDEPRNGRTLQVDHKDNIKNHNWISNFQLLSQRKNCSKGKMQYKKSSKYTGVCWDKSRNKWKAQIDINGKKIQLGRYINEIDAHNAYQNKLKGTY